MPLMDGALIINKPAGRTSHDVIARVRKIIDEQRAGHTGTLDPFATGVLIVLVGRATRLAQFISGAEKEYEATVRLGYWTDTGDVTGTRIEPDRQAKTQSLQTLCKEEIEAALTSMCGEIEQVPPMYSAKKIGGRKLYELARSGQEVERKPVAVFVREFQTVAGDGDVLKKNDDGSVDLQVRVVCSAGTYVRTLAEDFAQKLGTAAHLVELRRTRAGRFTIKDSITLTQLDELMASQSVGRVLVSPYELLSEFREIELDDEHVRRTTHGIDLRVDSVSGQTWNDQETLRMCRKRQLIAVGRFEAARSVVHPAVVIGTE